MDQGSFDISQLKEAYLRDNNVLRLVQELGSSEPVTFIKGLSGSSKAFVLAAVMEQTTVPHLVVANDKEDAAYLYSDLANILTDSRVFFFPSSYKRAIQYGQTLPDAVIQRTDVLSLVQKLSVTPATSVAIVTYPEALVEKIVTVGGLEKSILQLTEGERISPSFITDLLLEYGFERVEFVYEPGQFSLRGSIVDIFSYTSSTPYRIDFFGDEVESIRSFDVETQLSIAKHSEVTILPNLQTDTEEHPRCLITEALPSSSIVWIKDPMVVASKMDEVQSAALSAETIQVSLSSLASGKEFLTSIKNSPIVEFGLRPALKHSLQIDFETAPQPPFNKNFELLAQDITDNAIRGYTIYILAENKNQFERLQNIFSSINQSVKFTPVASTVHEGYIDHSLKACLYTDHQIFDRFHKYRLKHEFSKRDALSIQELVNLQPGDYVVHIDHGIGVFSGLVRMEVNGKIQESVRLVYQDNDTLLVNIHNLHRISKYRGKDAEAPKVYKLGTGAWQKLKATTKKKVKDIAKDLIALYAKRRADKGFAFNHDTYLQEELEASFIFEDTPDQEKATKAVKEDMEAQIPMDRLVCGDVGFGKTEIAIRAAFKAVADNKQVAILVPTTILALQHYRTFGQRLKDFPCTVDFLSRLKPAKQQKETLNQLAEGKIDIVIGTHALLKEGIKFKDLGLLVVDEEQKFGVAAKEKLKNLRVNVDTLTLTATPIPRTLQFSLMGARDLSIINTPPPNRHPISTELHVFTPDIIKEAIDYELNRGGQVFFVHNRVQNIVEIQNLISRICPQAKSVVAHGQMDPAKLEKTMLEFISGDYDILISTTIIEAGLDIPNANTIIINNAHMFGLSDLHQLRGRVGRSNRKAFCYLLSPPLETLTNEARRRLKAIEEFSELGSGFSIAMQDLDIRGAGNLLGGEQSGFIADIGFETYQKILDEAIQELKETEFKDLFASPDTDKHKEWTPGNADCHLETDLELLLPDTYVSSIPERMKLYKELDSIQTPEQLNKFEANLTDRFGALPPQAQELMNVVRLRWLAISLGMEKLVLKNEIMIAYFISNQLSPFYRSQLFVHILGYIQKNPKRFKLKEGKDKLSLVANDVQNIQEALSLLQQIGNEHI